MNERYHRLFLALLLCFLASVASPLNGEAMNRELPAASHAKLPKWSGFNLLEKFMVHRNRPFVESDFQWISEMGFNFVRLPMDYRCWIVDGDWRKFNEDVLKEIDEAVAWGKQYGIHVNINFHRAPGYTVARPREEKDLWTNKEAQEVCALHWATFARRYKGIANANLSFNLFNEPQGVDGETHARVVKKIVEAIRAEDPARLIICDGLQWGSRPAPGLAALKVAQATRGYSPHQISHYRASWTGQGGERMPPGWPLYTTLSANLYGEWKKDINYPLAVKGPFPSGAELKIRVNTVSSRALLVVSGDGKELWRRDFVPTAGEGEWSKVVYNEEWKVYQNVYDRDYSVEIPAGTKRLVLRVAEGDWLSFKDLRIGPWPGAVGGEAVIKPDTGEWGFKADTVVLDGKGDMVRAGEPDYDKHKLWREMIVPFQEVEAKGVGVMVGEWGAYKHTPHHVVLAWMRDCLANWKQAGWGWALWNFRGSFGILDSGREDVKYEDWRGHRLDRQMLELLREYQ